MEVGFVFALIPISAVAILAFFIIGFNHNGKQGGRGKGLLSGFNYSVSVTMLAILVGSSIMALNIGLKNSFLTRADTSRNFPPSPSWLYLATPPTDASAKTVGEACTDSACALTAAQKESVTTWTNEYKSWQQNTTSILSDTERTQLISALSFFIVALPLFIIFFRTVQREHKRGQSITGMRSFYFYGVAVVGLLMTVISGAFAINSGLRTWIAPSDSKIVATPIYSDQTTYDAVQSLINCQATCGIADESVSAARDWLEQSKSDTYASSQIQNDLAVALPSLVVGLPLFLYHFITIRRETRKEDEPQTSQGTTA